MMDTTTIWHEFKASPTSQLKQEIIMSYEKLVHYVIHNSKFVKMEILDDRDYFQFGIEGLSEAIDRFDPDYGTKFETYAILRIRGKIIDEVRKIQIKPRTETYTDRGELKYYNVSLNKPLNDEDGYDLYETIPDESAEMPLEVTEKNESKEALIEAIKKLNERDRLIITLYYYENLTYKEIAQIMSITVSRVSQIHTRITELLKMRLKRLND